jgi:DICT domain-containing protein
LQPQLVEYQLLAQMPLSDARVSEKAYNKADDSYTWNLVTYLARMLDKVRKKTQGKRSGHNHTYHVFVLLA